MSAEHKLILVKHSMPEFDPNLPPSEWHLSEPGCARSETLARYLAAYSLDVIVSSVESKAIETSQIVARYLNKVCETSEGLHEHNRRNVPFLSLEQFDAKVAEFFAKPSKLVFGNETADEAEERFSNAIVRVVEKHPQKNVAIVAHGTVISLFVARAASVDPLAFWKRLNLPSFVVFSLPTLTLEKVVENVE